MGTLGGAVCYLFLFLIHPGFIPARPDDLTGGYLIFLVLFFLIGVAASGRMEKLEEKKDPPAVVIDEAFSFFITMFLIPWTAHPRGWLILTGGFVLNRLFDIRKPFPATRLEKLSGGWGIMLDDLIAGIYSNLLLRLILCLTR